MNPRFLKTFGVLLSVLLSLAVSPLWAQAQVSGQDASPTEYSAPLGIALEELRYPFAVKYLPLQVEGEPVRMAYMDVEAAGTPNGRTVVLLHGKNFYGEYWANTIRALRGAGYRVVVPDQIGFGKSSKPDIAYSFDLLAQHTAQLLDLLKISRVAVVGHSMGGMLAVRFARNYAQRTTQLVLENPIGLEDYRFKVPPRSTEEWYQTELQNTDATKIRAFLRRYFVRWQPEYESFVEVRSRIAHSGEYPRWAKSAALTYQMIYQQPVRHEFPLIQARTLLVIGQEDRTTLGRGIVSDEVLQTLGQYPQLGRAAARDIPRSRLIELRNVGHIPHVEAPEQFHNALLDFLRVP
jgi:pimeloyl-ACP methyl ester carboxylesterase